MRSPVIRYALATLLACAAGQQAQARGFGGFRAGGYGGFSASRSFSGYRGVSGGGYSFDRSSSFSGYGDRGFSSGVSRSGYGSYGLGGAYGHSSYDRSYTDARGGSLSVSGTRGAAVGYGGAAYGGTRDVSASTAGGRTFNSSAARGGVAGPYGNFAAGGTRTATASGFHGTVDSATRWGAAGTRFPSDLGLAHYTTVGGYGAVGHGTTFWSHGYVADRAEYVRSGFVGYNAFHPAWYTAHPGAWFAAGWAAGAAWTAATWPALATFVDIGAAPVYLDYGTTVVYQGNNVYVNGTDAATAEQYNQQAVALATAGQQAPAPKADKWQPLGVFALAQGDEKTSNTMFQLAVSQKGIIRGNYFDALMGTSTEEYGSVDPKTQRAAWTIGKNANTVFETGLYNLTKEQTPVLVHFGKDKTQQWLLVRVAQPPKAAE